MLSFTYRLHHGASLRNISKQRPLFFSLTEALPLSFGIGMFPGPHFHPQEELNSQSTPSRRNEYHEGIKKTFNCVPDIGQVPTAMMCLISGASNLCSVISAPMLPIHQRRALSPQNQEYSEVTLNSYGDSAALVEPIADAQTSQPTQRPPQLLQQQSQQQQPHQQHTRLPNHDVQLAFPGYFDPLTADPIMNTAIDIKVFARMLTTIPRILYFSLFFFLPFFYRTRVNQIFRGVHLTENEIAVRYASGLPLRSWKPKYWEEVKESWIAFIDSVVKEWATLNIISVLLLSAIYNVLQLGGTGSRLVQCTALMSLISALTSLVFGCLYVIRFETMRRPYKAMEWVQSAVQSSRSAVWNIFILLSLPFVWLSWSILLFIICLMSIIWQSGQTTSGRNLVPLSLEVKIIVSVLLFFGVIHLCLILIAFSQYGDIDENWTERFKRIARPASMAYGSTTGGPPPPPTGTPSTAQQQQHKPGLEMHQPTSQPQTHGATRATDHRHVSFQLPSREPASELQNPRSHAAEMPEPSLYPGIEVDHIVPMASGAPEPNMLSLPFQRPDQPYHDRPAIPQSIALPPAAPPQHYSNYGRTPISRAGSTPFDLVPPFHRLTPYFYGNYQTAPTAAPPTFIPSNGMIPPFASTPYYGSYSTTPAPAPSGRPRSNSFMPPFTSTSSTMVSPVPRRPEELHHILRQYPPPMGFEPTSYQPFVPHDARLGENRNNTEPQMIQTPWDFTPLAHQPAARHNAELGEDQNSTEPRDVTSDQVGELPLAQRRSATATTEDEEASIRVNVQSATPSSTHVISISNPDIPHPSVSAVSSSGSPLLNTSTKSYPNTPVILGPRDERRDDANMLYGYEPPPRDTGGNSQNTQTDRVQAAE